MVEAAMGVSFDGSGRAVVRIPEGFHGGDLVVLELQPGRALVRLEVLEALVRAYHERDELRVRDECPCGWNTYHPIQRVRRGQHAEHVEHVVREALAGRAAL